MNVVYYGGFELPESEVNALRDLENQLGAPLRGQVGRVKGMPVYVEPASTFLTENGHVTTLLLSNRDLRTLPPSVGGFRELAGLELHDNLLESLPESIGQLRSLQEINLARNNLTALPESVGNLTTLWHLNVDGNQLASLPENFRNLCSMSNLDLSGNPLGYIPPSLTNLQKLRVLLLRECQLAELPPEVGLLANLATLDLRDNHLRALPPEFRRLTHLRALGLTSNRFTEIPLELAAIRCLLVLEMEDNPWGEDARPVVERMYRIRHIKPTFGEIFYDPGSPRGVGSFGERIWAGPYSLFPLVRYLAKQGSPALKDLFRRVVRKDPLPPRVELDPLLREYGLVLQWWADWNDAFPAYVSDGPEPLPLRKIPPNPTAAALFAALNEICPCGNMHPYTPIPILDNQPRGYAHFWLSK